MLRTIHVLAVALWFGSVAFFTIAGVLIFSAFERESLSELRPMWFPLPGEFAKSPPPGSNLPDPLRKEQGSRAAGVAVSAIFPVYFALQTGCAAVAVLTATLLTLRQAGKLNTIRAVVCILGLATVMGGWWLERVVEDLRGPRNARTEAVIEAEQPSAEQIAEARAARAAFGKWHGISLLVNFATLALALTATGMAAHYPEAHKP